MLNGEQNFSSAAYQLAHRCRSANGFRCWDDLPHGLVTQNSVNIGHSFEGLHLIWLEVH
jgi:hypothetical protein